MFNVLSVDSKKNIKKIIFLEVQNKTKTMKFLCQMLLLFTLVSLSFASSRNPYEVLGVSPLATKGQIKKAWRDKAKFWHPDKNKSPEAPQKYSELREAYEVSQTKKYIKLKFKSLD